MPQHLDEIRAKNPQLAAKLTKNVYCVCGDDVEQLTAVNPNIQVLVKFNVMRVTVAVSTLNFLLNIVSEHTKLKAASLGMEDDIEITGRHGTDYVRGVSLLVG